MEEHQSTSEEQLEPENYPAEWIKPVSLRNGTQVVIRPIRPDDAPLLQAGFRQLSSESVYLRFLESFKELPDEQAQRYATVDYESTMAFVAEIRDRHGEPFLIASARYAMVGPQEPGVAESAIVVGDRWQGRGLGTMMMAHLVDYARQHGVDAFLATVHVSNKRIMRFIERSGFAFEKKVFEPGVWAVYIYLNQKAGTEQETTKNSE